jgi:abhydrolase domain-containing protein 12
MKSEIQLTTNVNEQNAGHLLQHHRPFIYRSFTSLNSNTHLIAFSYRGFGRSSGRPSEPGLITDGVTIVNFAMSELGVSPSNMALVGQSLGTAVVSGVAEYYGTSGPLNVPLDLPASVARTKTDFATIMLVAAFSDLKTLLLKYRIAGVVPILAPIARIPGVPQLLAKIVREPWESKLRIARVVKEALADVEAGNYRHVNLQFLHALDDTDIPYENAERIYNASLDAAIGGIGTRAQSVDQGNIKDGSYKRQFSWKNIQVSLRLLRRGGM